MIGQTKTDGVAFEPIGDNPVAEKISVLKDKIEEGLASIGLDDKVEVIPMWDGEGGQMIGLSGTVTELEYEEFGQLGARILTDEDRGLIEMIRAKFDDRVEIHPRV